MLSAQPMVDVLLHGPEHSTWAEAVQLALDDLPSTLAFFVVMVSPPVVLGALTGSLLRRLVRPGGARSARALA